MNTGIRTILVLLQSMMGIALFTCMDYLISIIIPAGADGVGTSLSSHPEMTDKIRFACQLS